MNSKTRENLSKKPMPEVESLLPAITISCGRGGSEEGNLRVARKEETGGSEEG